jgi:D-sedoheptulose 7-phosphate isomerase
MAEELFKTVLRPLYLHHAESIHTETLRMAYVHAVATKKRVPQNCLALLFRIRRKATKAGNPFSNFTFMGLCMSDTVIASILEHAEAGAELRRSFFARHAPLVANAALRMALTLARGNKLLFCGNGGSAADAQHLAAEFVNRFILDRPPLPAIALSTDTSILTAIGNDFGFDLVFSKQVQALGNPGDMLIALSTSGNSKNVLKAVEAAKEKGITVLGLTGNTGGSMASLCDMLIAVDSSSTPLIQEIHITVGHLLCGLTDYYLFENVAELTPFLSGAPLPAC